MEQKLKIKKLTDEKLLHHIYFLRGRKVMLDRDLAELYGVRAIRLREQVRRNKIRFPEHFMIQLTNKEIQTMVSQNAIPSRQHLGGTRPYAFTEHGLLMLANVLKSKAALAMSIRIIETFIRLRETLLAHKDILLKLEQLEQRSIRHDGDIKALFHYIRELLAPKHPPMRKIGFRQGSNK